MKLRAALVLALAALLPSVAAADPPLTFWRYGGIRDRGELLVGIECAVARWRSAACVTGLDVSLAGPHWIRWAIPSDLPEGRIASTTGNWYTGVRILLSTSIEEEAVCGALTHELMHVLIRDNRHLGPDGGMNWPVLHVHTEPLSKILPEDVTSVCAKQACGCFNPE